MLSLAVHPVSPRTKPPRVRARWRDCTVVPKARLSDHYLLCRLNAKLEGTDGPPPLHQCLLEHGIHDLAPFSKTRHCTYSFKRVQSDVEPKLEALGREGLSAAEKAAVLQAATCTSCSFYRVFSLNLSYLRRLARLAGQSREPPPAPLTALGALLQRETALMARVLCQPPGRLYAIGRGLQRLLGGSELAVAAVLLDSPQLFGVKAAGSVAALEALRAAQGLGGEKLLHAARRCPRLLAAPPEVVLRNAAALRLLLGPGGARHAVLDSPRLLAARAPGLEWLLPTLVGELGLGAEEALAVALRQPSLQALPEAQVLGAARALRAALGLAAAGRAVRCAPRILRCSPEALRGTVQALIDPGLGLGLALDELGKLVQRWPGVLTLRGTEIQDNLAALRCALGPCAAQRVALGCPRVLSIRPPEHQLVLQALERHLGLGLGEVVDAVQQRPVILALGSQPGALERLAEASAELRGVLGPAGVHSLVRLHAAVLPSLLRLSGGCQLARKLAWAAEALGWPAERVLSNAGAMRSSLRRMASRLAFLRAHGLPDPASFMPLTWPDAWFLRSVGKSLGEQPADALQRFEEQWLASEEGQQWGCAGGAGL